MKILFIGNSHTFYNAMPFQVREFLRRHNPAADVTMCATGGMTLGWHAGQLETRAAILYHDWDAIVLQQKTHPFDGVAALRQDCLALRPYLEKSRAKVLLYMTWAEKRLPANQAILDAAFTQVAPEIGATPAPISRAWGRLRAAAPAIELYDVDQEHASPAGSYLVACTFYALLTGRSPVGLPAKTCVNGDVLADIPAPIAQQIQQTVEFDVAQDAKGAKAQNVKKA